MSASPASDPSPPSDPRHTPRVAVEPKSGRYESLELAVTQGGGEVVSIDQAEALVWADPHAAAQLPDVIANGPGVRWIGLPFAGIEPFVPYLDDHNANGERRIWTAAKGVYATPVAEHALMLGLAGMRGLATYARAASWSPPQGTNLVGANVVIFGAGGITEALVPMLEPFGCRITVVRRQVEPVAGVHDVVTLDDRLSVLADADLVVLALALTSQTKGVIGRAELSAMKPTAWIVNVARGGHIDTDALVDALRNESIGGAALDVTDPEPLPPGHPLWSEPRAIITPHVGNTPEMGIPLLADHITDNVRRFAARTALNGVVDIDAGY
ncbi:MAG: D-isomer specific 2-hydroxyacid dehydrogenase family protein [Acidimicrobiales bacterium]